MKVEAPVSCLTPARDFLRDQPETRGTMVLDLDRLGAMLRETRKKQRFTARALGREAHLSAGHVLAIEAGENFTLAVFIRVAAALNLPPAPLLEAAVDFVPQAASKQTA